MSPSISSKETKQTVDPPEREAIRTYRKPEKRGMFGLRHGQRFARGKTFNTKDDYERTYPEDPIFEEMAPSARVWRAYLDECQNYDAEMIEGWRDTVDVLLVFAGLFSAVVTTFVVQTLQSLQPDFNEVSAFLLFELVSIQRALANGTSLSDVPPSQLTPDSSFTPSSLIIWTNGLWFVSLSLSLTIALVAVLTKQWIHHYMSVPSGTPRYRSRIRHFRYMGLEKWHVPVIVGLLPLLMHSSLALFFVGLVLFLISLHIGIAIAVGVISGIGYIFYVVTNVLSIQDPQCPYRTPLSGYAYVASNYMYHSMILPFFDISSSASSIFSRVTYQCSASSTDSRVWSLDDVEQEILDERASDIDIQAISWLYSTTFNPTLQSIVMQSIGGLPIASTQKVRKAFADIALTEHWQECWHELLRACVIASPEGDDTVEPREDMALQMDRLLRVNLLLQEDPAWELQRGFDYQGLRLSDSDPPELRPIVVANGSRGPSLPSAIQILKQGLLGSDQDVCLCLHPIVWAGLLDSAVKDGCFEPPAHNAFDIKLCVAFLGTIPQEYFRNDEGKMDVVQEVYCARLMDSIYHYLYPKVGQNLLRMFSTFDSPSYEDATPPCLRLLLAILAFMLSEFREGEEGSRPLSSGDRELLALAVTSLRHYVKFSLKLSVLERQAIFSVITGVIACSTIFCDAELQNSRTCISILNIFNELVNPRDALFPSAEFPRPVSWCTEPIIKNLLQATFNDDFWARSSWLDTVFGQGYETKLRVLCPCFRQGISIAFEVFQREGYLSTFTEHRFDSRLLEITVAYVTGLSSLSPQRAEYAHQPENLLTLVTILALGGKGIVLLALARIHPEHPAWTECLAKIREDITAIQTGVFDEWRNDNFQRSIVKLEHFFSSRSKFD
ncbi:hypothetical protein DFS33DRAFT_1507424 [Desarmillaria ectypa]|nr:hypothetical protein DFS33DRAFT_1507424 [Desarmillaria ectypa]